MRWQQVVLRQWQRRHWMCCLWPLATLYARFMTIRNWLYNTGILKITHISVPVWVIGNITVGGTGKTALVIHLAKLLQSQGLQVGVISRGYGGQNSTTPIVVNGTESPDSVGDEALLMQHKTLGPVVVCSDRVKAAQTLLNYTKVDVILSDDGLQHRRLGRDFEIVIQDAYRGTGNGWCLPAGPLREPTQRLKHVDCVIEHGAQSDAAYHMYRLTPCLYAINAPREIMPISAFQQTPMHWVTAIGNPERLFNNLQDWGIKIASQSLFNDHYLYKIEDFEGIKTDLPILTTEKDSVKMLNLKIKNKIWVLEEKIYLSEAISAHFLKKAATLKVHS